MIGSTIGNYNIIDELGRGGMAVVYRAHDPRFRRDVALKVLPREFMHDPTFQERFVREARAIAQLEHPAIVPVYDFGEDDGQPYFVMRYMPGGSLADRIVGGPLPFDEVSKTIDRVGSALDAAHARAIIHRDVKPGNVLFDNYGEAYLSDFGIVRLTESTAHLTGSGIVGTPAYMAPELAGKGGLTSLVDVYALGVTLYQLLTGYRPFEADTPMGLIMAHISRPIPDIRSVRPDLPESLQIVINQSMAKDPAMRYQSAGELAKDLRQALAGKAVSTIRKVQTMPPLETMPDMVHAQPEPVVAPTMPEVQSTLPEVPPATAAPVLTQPTPKRKSWLWLGIGGGALMALIVIILLAGSLLLKLTGTPTPQVSTEVAAEPSPTNEPDMPTPVPADLGSSMSTGSASPVSTNTPIPVSLDAGTVDTNPVDGASVVYIPEGSFTMGLTSSQADVLRNLCAGSCFSFNETYFMASQPSRTVSTDSYWIYQYEVTNRQYQKCVAAGNCAAPDGYNSETRSSYYDNLTFADYPVVFVSWYDAGDYCNWAGGHLPTEIEWEKAARGTDGRLFPWGDSAPSASVANAPSTAAQGSGDTTAVGSYPSGASSYGVYDMAGNVWEWIGEWHETFPGEVSGRGGSFRWGGPFASSAYRDSWGPDESDTGVGFRCVLSKLP